MKRIDIFTSTGIYKVSAVLFKYKVGEVEHQLAFHRRQQGLGITHVPSGCHVVDIPQSTISSCLGDSVSAAKMTMNEFVSSRGEERVNKGFASAAKIGKYKK